MYCKYFECKKTCKTNIYCASCREVNGCSDCRHEGLCIHQPTIENVIAKIKLDKSKNGV